MSHYTHLIWDFNGTLLDDVDLCIACANRLLKAYSLPPLSGKEAYRTAFGFPIIDYYRRLGFDFETLSYHDLAIEWVDYYMEGAKTAALFPDVLPVLEQCKRMGMQQIVLSATERGMLEEQIKSLGIKHYFDALLGQDNIHAFGKAEIGQAWKRTHPEAKLLFLGDTDHDADVARAMDADCILLSTGHQSRAALEACDAIAVLDSLSEIIPWITQMNGTIAE